MKGIIKTPDARSTSTSTPKSKRAHAGRLLSSPVADAFHYNNEDGTSYYDYIKESQSGKIKRRQNMVAEKDVQTKTKTEKTEGRSKANKSGSADKGVLTKIEETVDGLSEFQKASAGMLMCLFILLMYYLENC